MSAAGLSTPRLRAGALSAAPAGVVPDRWIRRRVGVIWALLFFNGLGSSGDALVPVARQVEQVMATAALFAALMLALSLNRRLLVRPSLVLGMSTILLVVAATAGVRSAASLGTEWRSVRFGLFLATLWLLTPWWGRRDLLLARCHLRALVGVSATVVAGLLLAPSRARPGDRLSGILWPIPPPQVAEYAALGVGMTIVLWLAGCMGSVRALLLTGGGLGIVFLTETRTPMGGLAGGLVVAALTMFLARRRVRRVVTVAVIVTPMLVVALSPTFSTWLTRGQNSAEIQDLTGRREVWTGLLATPRPGLDRWIGFGLSNKSFDGRSIDNDWLAVYQDEGLIGDAVIALIFLILLVTPAFRPAGPARALAIFLAVYCAIASYTEVGLGDASPYLLHAIVAASLIVPAVRAPLLVESRR